jgi:hypothetical protein
LAGISGLAGDKISMRRTAWLTSEDSNLHIPNSEMPFEMSGEFRAFSSKSGVGDFCSCKLSILDPQPSVDFAFFGRCAELAKSALPQRAEVVSWAAYVRFVPIVLQKSQNAMRLIFR